MVGDHAFSYVTSLTKETLSKDEQEIANRTVPYLVWSNYSIDTKPFTEYTSMTDLVPSVVYSAGIELDVYYKNVLNLHEQMPGKTTFGLYIDNDGLTQNCSDNPEVSDAWNKYLFAEYYRLIH